MASLGLELYSAFRLLARRLDRPLRKAHTHPRRGASALRAHLRADAADLSGFKLSQLGMRESAGYIMCWNPPDQKPNLTLLILTIYNIQQQQLQQE